MIDFDKFSKGDWILVKSVSNEIMSLLHFKYRKEDDFIFDTFYFGPESTEKSGSRKPYWFINDKWFRYELKEHNVVDLSFVKQHYIEMFETLFKGKIKDESK